MPPCKVTALFEIMQYGVHRILTLQILFTPMILYPPSNKKFNYSFYNGHAPLLERTFIIFVV